MRQSFRLPQEVAAYRLPVGCWLCPSSASVGGGFLLAATARLTHFTLRPLVAGSNKVDALHSETTRRRFKSSGYHFGYHFGYHYSLINGHIVFHRLTLGYTRLEDPALKKCTRFLRTRCKKWGNAKKRNGRDGEIRTRDLCTPSRARGERPRF